MGNAGLVSAFFPIVIERDEESEPVPRKKIWRSWHDTHLSVLLLSAGKSRDLPIDNPVWRWLKYFSVGNKRIWIDRSTPSYCHGDGGDLPRCIIFREERY